ncbi:MAG: aldehyde ferredoxin oxidoreductase family protein [Promethearchaeota archaeon]|jgi:aldehyde:ferredoxin oxidoreductase
MGIGFFGKILWVNLEDKTFREETLPKKIYRDYLGGYGLAVKLIYDRMEKGIDPLSPGSILGFFPGLLTGTTAPLSGRYAVTGKSPLTETWGDANSGGTFGPEIKKCGYDAILFKGAANTPQYISIIGEEKQFLDASDIFGLDIIKSENKLKKRHGKFIKTAIIGKAGERLSKMSGIVNDRGRIAARSGLGALMGSKNLKALVLKGNKNISMNDRKSFNEFVKSYNLNAIDKDPGIVMKFVLYRLPNMAKTIRRLKVGMSGPSGILRQVYRNLGTSAGNTIAAENGDSPIKNWSGIGMYDFPFKQSVTLSVVNIIKYKIREYGCYSCPIQCGAILSIPELNIDEMHLPEYETCSSFGSLLLNDDLMSIFQINDLCNREGIDTISTGATIGFAIECFERGIITKSDTDGLDLTWGNSQAILDLVRKIINREGLGDVLADGSKIATKRLGIESEKYAMTSFGSEIPMHNPRFFKSLAFSYAYDPSPGRHSTASIDFIDVGNVGEFLKGLKLPRRWRRNTKRKIKAQKIITGIHQVINSAGLCLYSTLFGCYPLVELLNFLTGWDMDIDECIKTGLRIQTLRQAFNIREGVDITQNELSGRIIGDPPDEKGPSKGITVDYKDFYKNYCREMGWNPINGYPLKETLQELNLEFVIKDLY